MFNQSTTDNTSRNIRTVSLAAGLALATAAVIGGSNLLKETSSSTAPVTPRVERIAPQFGTAADAVYASQAIRAPSQFGSMADGEYLSVGLEYIQSARGPAEAVAGRDGALGLGQPAVGQSFATADDAVYAVESLHPQANTVAVDTGEYLGLGQPAEGARPESPMFSTMADADFASR